jgi:2-amino-4-hydroxy-6-hydroxymethyldihydropteridine diphosphokinase
VAAQQWVPAYVGLGSNLDDPRRQIERAFDALAQLPDSRLVLRSRLYRSKPLGPVTQPDFINAAAGLLTRLAPLVLLHALKSAERELGRERPIVHWGPRRIDLDLLVHGSARVVAPELTLPHPGLAERAFVLAPLADIAPELRVADLGLVREMLDAIDTRGLERLPP